MIASNRKNMLKLLKSNPYEFCEMDDEFRNDWELAYSVVSFDGGAYHCIGERLLDDKEIFLKAHETYTGNLRYSKLTGNREICIVSVRGRGSTLQDCIESFRDDYEIVSLAVEQDGFALAHASNRLKDNPTIVSISVNKSGRSFQFASNRLKRDKGFCLDQVMSNPNCLEFFDLSLINDVEILRAAFEKDKTSILSVSEKIDVTTLPKLPILGSFLNNFKLD